MLSDFFSQTKLLHRLSVVFLLLITFFTFCGLSDQDLNGIAFNSDALYLPSIYKDIYLDGNTLAGWHLNPSPGFFPDMPIYFIANWITGDLVAASMLFAMIQVALISFLVTKIFKHITEHHYAYAAGANLMLSLFLFVEIFENDFHFTFHLLWNCYHLGVFLNTLVGVLLVFQFLKSNRKIWLVALFFYGCISVVSDRLFIVEFALPMLCALTLISFKRWRQVRWLLPTVLGIVFGGMWAYKALKNSGWVYLPEAHQYMNFENIKLSFNILLEQVTAYVSDGSFKAVILLVSLAAFIASLVYLVRNRMQYFRGKYVNFELTNKDIFVPFLAAYLLGVFVAPVLNGSYTGWDTIRYNYPVYIVGCVFFFFLLGPMIRSFLTKARPLFVVLGIVAVVWTASIRPVSGFSDYLSFYPDRVEELDKIVEENDLKYGLAPYWEAKVITMFSKHGLRVYTAFDQMTPWEHVTNHNWHKKSAENWEDEIVYDFVLAGNDLMKSNADSLLGPFLNEVKQSRWTMLKTHGYRYNWDNYHPYLIEKADN